MKIALFSVWLLVTVVGGSGGGMLYPSRQGRKFEPNEIISDRQKVLDALKCIRGEECPFPKKYANLLREAGPTLLVYGYCPPRMCTYDDELKAKDLLHRISIRYPKAFYYTFNQVRSTMAL